MTKARIFGTIACFMLCLCLHGSALARDQPVDLKESEPALIWAVENGYLDGGPEGAGVCMDMLTGQVFIHALCAEWFPELLDMDYAGRIQWLHGEGHLTGPEYEWLLQDKVNRIMVWRVMLAVSSNWPRSASCLPEVAAQEGCNGAYADARATVVCLGLAPSESRGTMVLPCAEFFGFFRQFLETDFSVLSAWEAGFPGADLIDQVASMRTQANYRAWNGYFKGYGSLPEKWVDVFRDTGWTFVFHDTYDGAYTQFRDVQGGLTVPGMRRIYLNRVDERGLYHEFGHFVMLMANLRERIKPVFMSEASAMQQILGDYSQTSAEEYFADCFSFWLQDVDRHPAILMQNSPGMYEILFEVFLEN